MEIVLDIHVEPALYLVYKIEKDMTHKVLELVERALNKNLIKDFYLHEGFLYVDFLDNTCREKMHKVSTHVREKFKVNTVLYTSCLQVDLFHDNYIKRWF